MIMFFSGDDHAASNIPETILKNPPVMLTFWWWEKQSCGRLKRHLKRRGCKPKMKKKRA